MSKFQPPTTPGDHQNVDKTIRKKIGFFESWKSVLEGLDNFIHEAVDLIAYEIPYVFASPHPVKILLEKYFSKKFFRKICFEKYLSKNIFRTIFFDFFFETLFSKNSFRKIFFKKIFFEKYVSKNVFRKI